MSTAFAQARSTARFHPAVRAAGLSRASAPDAPAHRRARAHWPIRLIGAGDAVVSGWVSDVSESGLGLMSSVNMPVGTLLETALAIPHPKDRTRSLPVRARVRVVSSSFCGKQSRLGVQFLALPMEARMAIHTYAVKHS